MGTGNGRTEMSVGTLITVDSETRVIKRQPIWPFPERTAFPRRNADGTTTYFFPRPYYEFWPGDKLDPKDIS